MCPFAAKSETLASIYSFNGTGSLIWQLLESPQTVEELSAGLAREYAVEHEQAQKDVAQFVGEMLSVGLVDVCKPPAMIAESQAQAEWQSAAR